MEIFKTYDIRGKYSEDEINPLIAFKIGKAFACFHKGSDYVVGHDARLHSRELYEAAIRGLESEGKRVVGIGLVSTPALHYIQVNKGFHGGLMLTASHNPGEYHGFKLFDDKGGSISFAKGLDKIKEIVYSFSDVAYKNNIPVVDQDLLDEYVDFLAEQAGNERFEARFAIDISNGSAGRVIERLAAHLSLDAIILNGQPDGTFPVHSPNPLEEKSREFIGKQVKEKNATFGVILDGDGDRVLFADENGTVIENYFMSALFAEELLANNPGQAIVYDLISSRVLPERIAELGGIPVISRVGYTFLYDKMVSEHAVFGAEASGHVYFRVTNSFYTESAAYAVLLLLKILKRKKEKLSALIRPLRERYYQAPEINEEIKDKDAALIRIEKAFSNDRIEKLDGISADCGDFWFNVRPSNTEPLLRIRLEARDKAAAEEALEKLRKLIG